MFRTKVLLTTLMAVLFKLFFMNVGYAQYSIVPQHPIIRGHLWIGNGVARVFSSNNSTADRFRLGGEVHLGDEYQYILGWTFYDRLFSGETSSSVGDISRRSTDFSFGYFVVPDKLWLMYSLAFTDVSGNAVIGAVGLIGHQASAGYRFFSKDIFNMAIEIAYLFIPSYMASTYNPSTSTFGSVKFPTANVWGLNLRFGFDMGSK